MVMRRPSARAGYAAACLSTLRRHKLSIPLCSPPCLLGASPVVLRALLTTASTDPRRCVAPHTWHRHPSRFLLPLFTDGFAIRLTASGSVYDSLCCFFTIASC